MTVFDLANDWLRYSKSDLTTAKHMFENVNPKENEISCYHAQQCAEKAIKAFLISKMIDPPRIHDLVELNNICIVHDKDFSTIQKYCINLNPYGVHVRYPNELLVDDIITKNAIENAQKILEFCEKLINK